MSLVPLTKARKLLKDSGRWVLDHKVGNHGNFKHPRQKKGTAEVFQQKVEEYAMELALAANIVARDAPHSPEKKGWDGQHWRSGKYREMILPEDVEIAVRMIDEHRLSPQYILQHWMLGETAIVVGPDKCKICDNKYTHLVSCSLGFACPHCLHIVRSMTLGCKEGDPLPGKEVMELKDLMEEEQDLADVEEAY